MSSCRALDQAHQMGLPNSGGQSFAGDVAHGQSKDGVELHHLEKVSREMAHGENFSGDLELAPDEFARGAEPPLHLGRLIDGLLQLCLFTAHCIQFLSDRMDVLRKLSSRCRLPTAFRLMSSIFSVCAIMLVSSYEFVADSMHRQKKTWLLRNWFEFLANPHNVSVHRARGRKILIAPDIVEQPVAAHRLPGMTQKMLQQLKLLTRKLHRLTTTQDLVAAQVHVDIAEGIAVLLFRERLCPSQNGLHASEQFSDREGLGDVVIGSEFETHNLIHFLAARRKHDDGNRGALGL